MVTSAIPSAASCAGVEFHPELVAHARGILGLEGDRAEDVVQEAFVILLRRTRDGDPPHSPRPWLHSVVSSLCLRELNRRRRGQPTEIEDLAASGVDPAELVQIGAEMRWALASVAALPGRERAVMLDDLAGVTLGREGANSRYQALHRARRKLRSLRREAWGLVPFPLLRVGRFGGSAHTGLGSVGAPAAIGGGVAKGAIAAATIVAALGGAQIVASIPSSGSPAAAARVTVTTSDPSGSAASAQTPAAGGGLTVVHRRRLVRTAPLNRTPSASATPAATGGAGPRGIPSEAEVGTRPLGAPSSAGPDAPQATPRAAPEREPVDGPIDEVAVVDSPHETDPGDDSPAAGTAEAPDLPDASERPTAPGAPAPGDAPEE